MQIYRHNRRQLEPSFCGGRAALQDAPKNEGGDGAFGGKG
jgi:hypothetical protein